MRNYNYLKEYLRREFGTEIRKICVDGGFTCPNRDGTCGRGGCTFCGERGAGEHMDPALSIRTQVTQALARYERRYGERARGWRYIVYFQNFTNTYAPPEVLRARYDAALADPRIAVLSVATRPDCINREVAELLASYLPRVRVWVELGLQTAIDRTAQRFHRGYPTSVFSDSVRLLSTFGLPVTVHLMLGLPGEGEAEVAETVRFLNRHDYAGIKIHALYVMEGTQLAEDYRNKCYEPICEGDYIRQAAYILTHISPRVVVHRLTGDCPRGLLLAPDWNGEKCQVIEAIDRRLRALGLRQGDLYDPQPRCP